MVSWVYLEAKKAFFACRTSAAMARSVRRTEFGL
jgi:hypothetical protein